MRQRWNTADVFARARSLPLAPSLPARALFSLPASLSLNPSLPPYPPYLPTLLSSLWYMQEDTPAGKVPKVASTSSVTYVKNKPSLPKPLGSVVSQILVHIKRGKNKKSVISKKISAKPKKSA